VAEAAFRFAVAGEDERHFQCVTLLIDARLREIDWLHDVLESIRVWQADPQAPERYLKLPESRHWTEPVSIRPLARVQGA
jgi:hypothetical protein